MRITEFIEYLEIKRPYEIQIKRRNKKNCCADYRAIYTKKRALSHMIRVYMGSLDSNDRNLETLIAHELIHAWQEEKGLKEIHGPFFIRMAKLMSIEFNLPEIYLQDTDKP